MAHKLWYGRKGFLGAYRRLTQVPDAFGMRLLTGQHSSQHT
jgi:hypothetical protein